MTANENDIKIHKKKTLFTFISSSLMKIHGLLQHLHLSPNYIFNSISAVHLMHTRCIHIKVTLITLPVTSLHNSVQSVTHVTAHKHNLVYDAVQSRVINKLHTLPTLHTVSHNSTHTPQLVLHGEWLSRTRILR